MSAMAKVAIVCLWMALAPIVSALPMLNHNHRMKLYFPEDDVEVLDTVSFKQKVENSSRAWIVEFYAAWCGDCQRFAPSWKVFARDVFAWKDLVQVAVLDCSDERNSAICSEYEVIHYPTLRYFREYYQSSLHGVGVPIDATKAAVDEHRRHLLDRIMAEINEGRGQMYPNLLPFGDSDLSKLIDEAPNGTEYVFLVVEPVGAYMGAEVAMDLHKTPNVVVRRAFHNDSDLVDKLDVDKFPAIVVVDNDRNVEVIPGRPQSREEVKETISRFLEGRGMEVVEEVAPKKESPPRNFSNPQQLHEKELRGQIKKMGDVVFLKDLEAALRYSLKQEVSVIKTIRNERLDALIAYLKVLKKYFPFSYRASPFLRKLSDFIDAKEVEGWRVAEAVRDAEENALFSSDQGFLGCRGSFPKFRGYPCSLWMLFHYLTVNAEDEAEPREVLDAVHGYVEHFFGCAHCSHHFRQMALRRNLTSVGSLEESILWLWAAHNEVNDRLKGDATEDPEHPKSQFPSREACPSCVSKDGSWDEEEVLKYLKSMYGSLNLRYLGTDTRYYLLGLN